MVRKNILDKRIAFSLVEALVVMTVAAIFVAVMASVIPHKAKPKISAEAHGGFECYWKADNKLYSRAIKVGKEETTEKEENGTDTDGSKYCVFRSTQYIPYIIINAVGGGARGSSDKGGNAGRFASAYSPVPQPVYKLYPGKGGQSGHTNGYPSSVKVGDNEILKVEGGSDTLAATDLTVSDIVEVTAVAGMGPSVEHFGCNHSPRAWLNQTDKKIHVEFCKDQSTIIEETLSFSDKNCNGNNCYNTILNSPVVTDNSGAKVLSKLKDGTVNVWEYYDVGALFYDSYTPLILPDGCDYYKITQMNNPHCPSRYKLEIKLNIPDNGEEGAVSSLTKYANLLKYDKLKEIKPGNGGAKNYQNGKPGGILITW